MADPIEDIIGDYRAFAAQQRDRLTTRGIDITPYTLSHIAYRVPEWDEYVRVRGLLERHAIANRENFWNGRPISLILFDKLEVLDGKALPMIELIPPVHQRVYKMGMEHIGVVIGEDTFEEFKRAHRPVLTGQMFQGPTPGLNEPVLHPVRGLHAREVPSALAAVDRRTARRPIRWLPSRRRLGSPAVGNSDRPEPAVAITGLAK